MPQPVRSPSRRLTRDERVARIITVTRAMLVEMGHDGIVTAEVAKRCGISEATIYKYFDSKRDLLIYCAKACAAAPCATICRCGCCAT
ncbi:MAG: TetR/AcrR family transcriptional regulator [Burkholderiales bacterium]